MKKLVAGLLLASSAFSVSAAAQGSDGIAVVQKRLVELGYKVDNTTGEWAPRTRNAIAFSPIVQSSFVVGLHYESIDYEADTQEDKLDAGTAGAFVGFGF